jgi:hypothetical protein
MQEEEQPDVLAFPPWERRMADAECIGVYCFRSDIPVAPKGMPADELWAWDMGYRLEQHLQMNGIR